MSAIDNTPVTVDWTTVAPGWDSHRDRVEQLSTGLTDAILAALRLQPGDRVLELGAGTGELARRLSAAVGDGGQVTATDVAAGMVELIARTTADLDNVDSRHIDAARIDLPDSSYDAVAFRMGLMFVVPPIDGLRECRRVLSSAGRLAATTWAAAEHNMWLAAVGMAATVHGVLSGILPTDPGGPLSLTDPAELQRLAQEAGFDHADVESVELTAMAASVDDHLAQVTSLAPGLAQAFDAADVDQLTAVRASLAELLEPYRTDAGFAIPGRALLLVAH